MRLSAPLPLATSLARAVKLVLICALDAPPAAGSLLPWPLPATASSAATFASESSPDDDELLSSRGGATVGQGRAEVARLPYVRVTFFGCASTSAIGS